MPVDRSVIRVKAMLVAPNGAGTAHAVSLDPPTAEDIDEVPGHEIVFLYSGRLEPLPATEGATLTGDGSVVPVVRRPFDDGDGPLLLCPTAAALPWVARVPPPT